jgi:hypothetical protein
MYRNCIFEAHGIIFVFSNIHDNIIIYYFFCLTKFSNCVVEKCIMRVSFLSDISRLTEIY